MNHLSTVRIGIIGCGHFGNIHADAFSKIKRVRLVAFCNRTIEKAEVLRRRYNGSFATKEPNELIDSKDIDGIIIATHHDSHAELCTRGALAGKHILVEKPLGMSLRECQTLARQVGEYGSRIAVGYKLRFAPTIQRARELLKQPYLIIGQMCEDPWSDDYWPQDPICGGGFVLSTGCHTFDMVCYLAQSRPIRVYAEAGALSHPGHPCLDHMVGTIAFENGALGVLAQGQSGTPARASKFQFSLFGANNTAIEIHNRLLSGSYRIGTRVDEIERAGDEAIFEQAVHFVAQICDGVPPVCGLWDGLLPNLLFEATVRANNTKIPQEIYWDGDQPRLASA